MDVTLYTVYRCFKRRYNFFLATATFSLTIITLNVILPNGRCIPVPGFAYLCQGTQHDTLMEVNPSLEKNDNSEMTRSIQELQSVHQPASVRAILETLRKLQTNADKTKFLNWTSDYLKRYESGQEDHDEAKGQPSPDDAVNDGDVANRNLDRPDSAVNQKDDESRTTETSQVLVTASPELPACPETPPDLIGLLHGIHTEISMDKLNAMYTTVPTRDGHYAAVATGGHYKPQECKALQKLAVIIPYRNRYSHLLILLQNLIPILQRQQSDFRIFVIEQDLPTTFNRGMLQNVGYLEALKYDQFDCFVFHDVDMLLLNDKCLYRCSNNPKHMAAGTSKWHYRLPYGGYFGGVTAFSREQYRKINGNSNLYFGWGGEDDDLRMRVTSKKYNLFRYPVAIGRYDMIKHNRDSGNTENKDRMGILKTATRRMDVEGLSTTRYKVTLTNITPLITWIHVSINMTDVLMTTPQMTKDAINFLLKQSRLTSLS